MVLSELHRKKVVYMFGIICLVGFAGAVLATALIVLSYLKNKSLLIPYIGFAVFMVVFGVFAFLTIKEPIETVEKPSETIEVTQEPSPTPESQVPSSILEQQNPSVEPTEQIAPIETSEPLPTPAPPETKINIDTIMDALRISLSQNFGENNYTLEYDDTGVTINLWEDNIAKGSALAASGNTDAVAAWSVLVDGQKFLCNSVVDETKAIGLENYVVMLNVLNDMDKDRTLLSIVNGVVIYDAVND